MSTSNINNAQSETAANKRKIQTEADKDIIHNNNELREVYSIKDIPVKDKKMFERIQKVLLTKKLFFLSLI